MSPAGGPRWGFVATLAFAGGLIAAVVVWFALPDQRWIAALLAAMAVLDLFLVGRLMPRLTRQGSAASEIDRLNAEAAAADSADDDWSLGPKP
jgi:hypothetical protein